jgi:hypothetical protein
LPNSVFRSGMAVSLGWYMTLNYSSTQQSLLKDAFVKL